MLCPFHLFAQFNGDFQSLENWKGDTHKFEVDSLGQLHLLAEAETDKAIIWHNSYALIHGRWQIDVAMDFFLLFQLYLFRLRFPIIQRIEAFRTTKF